MQEITKLAIFSILGEKVLNAACLDLYAGSGNMGLEALSRGANWCDFIDNNWNAKQAIEKNIKFCGFEEKAETHLSEAVKFVANTENKYDVVFCDPFYDDLNHKFLIKNMGEVLNTDGYIFFLHSDKLNMENLLTETSLVMESQRKYGKTLLSILRLK